MDTQFWEKIWHDQNIAFHQAHYHPLLLELAHHLGDLQGRHVLVPLAGKSQDICWLMQQGAKITAIELSELAVTAFFEENQLNFSTSSQHGFTCYQSDSVTFLCGDIFKLKANTIQAVDIIYDRAALVALDKNQRKHYVRQLQPLLKPASTIFLICAEYTATINDKPPYSVSEEEVHNLYGEEFSIACLKTLLKPSLPAHLAARGFKDAVQRVFLLDKY